MALNQLSGTHTNSLNGVPVPKYYYIKETILERIATGTWTAGVAIPPEPALC